MKKLLFLSSLLLVLWSCGGNKTEQPTQNVKVEGEWVLSSYSTKSVNIGGETVDVYLKFGTSSFDLYQMLGAGRYTHFTGTYTLSGTTLSGKYSDGKSWSASYAVSMDGKNLQLSRQPDNTEVQVFSPTSIPASVTSNVY